MCNQSQTLNEWTILYKKDLKSSSNLAIYDTHINNIKKIFAYMVTLLTLKPNQDEAAQKIGI
jgi:hypothetical protein